MGMDQTEVETWLVLSQGAHKVYSLLGHESIYAVENAFTWFIRLRNDEVLAQEPLWESLLMHKIPKWI